MPSGRGEVPSWRCFGGLRAFFLAPAADVAIAAARRDVASGEGVVGSEQGGRISRGRCADDSYYWRLEGS
uniref:Uncharacterized protein n=1 Tax=Arundo donax TaxID=35708 RepID=A0A0A9D6G7_ARUDO